MAIPVNSPYRPILHALAECRCSREDVISLEDVIPLDRCTRKLAGARRRRCHDPAVNAPFLQGFDTEYRIVLSTRRCARPEGRAGPAPARPRPVRGRRASPSAGASAASRRGWHGARRASLALGPGPGYGAPAELGPAEGRQPVRCRLSSWGRRPGLPATHWQGSGPLPPAGPCPLKMQAR